MGNKILRFMLLRKYRIALILMDVVFINLVIYASVFLLNRPQPLLSFYLFATLAWLLISFLFQLYSVSRYAISYIGPAVFGEWLILNLAALYIEPLKVARASLLLILPFMLALVLGNRVLFRWVKSRKDKADEGHQKRVLILGVDNEAKEIAEVLKNGKQTYYDIVGFLSDSQPIESQDIKVDPDLVLGNINDLYRTAKKKRVNEVIIAFPLYTPLLHRMIDQIVRDHHELGLSFKVCGHLFKALVGRLKMRHRSDYFLFDVMPETSSTRYLIYKRLFDILVSFLGLLLLLPAILLIAFILKFCEKAPVFFKNERIGELGQPFILYKFRSMVPDAANDKEPARATENDVRVTPFGRFLRRSSLDELPQLWNVLKGDMSLVGPRPEMTFFVNSHKELKGKRLNVKPGITGLAQVNGRQHLTARHKAKYDYIYLKNRSFVLDMQIVLQTIRVVLSKQGTM